MQNLDMSKISGATEESLQMFSCILSLSTWAELAEEKDCIGFGLAVVRPEWTIDDPTQMRIMSISNTCLSKSSMENALRCAIDLQGHVKATGGFGIGTEMGVAVRGSGREPINSWLPLYVNQEHWKVTSILLKQILGYFVALDPLAYATGQAEAMLLVLGTMAARVRGGTGCGEHSLRLMFQYQRTCLEVAKEFKLFPFFEAEIKHFIKNSPYETRDQVKNLVAVAAYLLILPLGAIDRLFPTEYEWVRFWSTILAVAIRRSAFTVFNYRTEEQVRAYLENLVHGGGVDDKTVCSDDEFLKLIGATTGQADLKEDDQFADCKIKPPQETDPDVIAATPVELKYDPTICMGSSAEMMQRFVRQMERRGYPTVAALTSMLSFTTGWFRMFRAHGAVSQDHLLHSLDPLYGVAPDIWITAIKASCGAEVNTVASLGEFMGMVHQSARFIVAKPSDAPNMGPPIAVLSRALVGMGVRWRVNKPAREAIDAGAFMQPFDDPLRCLVGLHQETQKDRSDAVLYVAITEFLFFDFIPT